MEEGSNGEPDQTITESGITEMEVTTEVSTEDSVVPVQIENNEILSSILQKEEYDTLNETLKQKIETALQESNKNNLIAVALHETYKTNIENSVQQLKEEINNKNNEIEEFKNKLDAAVTEITTLQEQLLKAEEDVKTANEKCKQMSYEWQDFKTQRDLACDEKESLLTMIERRNSELMVLREEKVEMTKKVDAAIKAKMAAMENAQDVESQKIALNFKEQRLEQESSLLRTQLESLNEELAEKTQELLNLRRTISTKSVADESDLATKTEELRIALSNISDLKEANEKLSNRSEELLEKLSSQRESYDVMMDNFHQELSAQTKLAQLYKDMCTENEKKTEKLIDSIQELRTLLTEATIKYGELETKYKDKMLRFTEEISKRDECIQNLKKELQHANDLLEAAKQDSVDAAISSLSPCAAAASRLIKSGMTLTQIYTQYARVSEELLLEKEENRRLNLYVTTIVNEIEEKAPLLHQQRVDYEKAVSAAESLTKEMDRMIIESQELSSECADAKKTSSHLTRENQRLKKELADLARQVCYLVKAVEEARGGKISHDTAFEMTSGSAQDIISKHLVTFATIEDLQENNQKLLALVRQLSEKQEAVESVSIQEYHDLKNKKEDLEERMTALIEEMARQSKMLDLIRTQSQTYKKLYNQAMGNDPETPVTPGTPLKPSPHLVTSTPLPMLGAEQEKQLTEAKDKIKKLEEDLTSLKRSSRDKEAEVNSKVEKLSNEIKDWMFKNSKLSAQAEYNEEKSKVLEANLKVSKKQIQALEERNRTLSDICAKHEQTLVILKDQAMEAQSKLARAEVQREHLHQEVLMLKTAEARLTKEAEALNRERMSNSLLMNNLDGLKATIERSEAQGKLRLEVQLSEALKECSALRTSLRDEKDRFRELTNSLERQTSMAKERMMEEKTLADKARNDLLQVKNELEEKLNVIEELNIKIRELTNQPARSVIQSVSNSLDVSTKRIKELEKQVTDLESEKARFQIQLTSAQTSSKQYAEMAEASEAQLQNLVQEHHNCSQLLNDREKEWENKLEVLRKELEEAKINQKLLESANTQSSESNMEELTKTLEKVQSQLRNKESELAGAKTELQTLANELATAQSEINAAKQQAVEAESRYSQEVISHSQAIQSLNDARKQMINALEIESKQQQEKDSLTMILTEKTNSFEDQKKRANEEIQQLTSRVKDLDEQNRLLHQTLEKLGDEVTILQAKVGDPGETSSLETSLNTSQDLNNKAQEQLMKVILFLRQEKDIAVTKSEVLQTEATRLKSQIAVMKKEIDEVKANYANLKQSMEVSETTSSKHAELLRKVESLNAVTDSNRLLREERDRFKSECNQLNEKLSQTEASSAPSLAELTQLKSELENLATERQVLKEDADRWKARSARLSERTKASPEDWRRLNNEKETFSKQYAAEKSKNEKLEEDLKKLRADNATLTQQITELRTQLLAESAKLRRLAEESNVAKQKQSQTDEELNTVRAQVKKLTDDVTKATEDGTAKDVVITDLRTKETQIKKIAKKYKNQYEELLKTNEENIKKRAEEDAKRQEEAGKPVVIPDDEQERLRAEGRTQVTVQITELEVKLSDKQKELDAKVTAAVEEAETLKKDNESLKTSINEKEERARNVLKTARIRIGQLTEQKQTLELELSQIRDDNDSKINTLKSNYDAIIDRLQKDRTEQVELANQERERLANQIKALNQRINQMQRSLDKPKPTTSSQAVQKSSMEPPTANIKPMAGSSTVRKQHPQTPTQQLVGPYWAGGNNETPFASIRPVQTRTLAVQPTSVGSVSPATTVPSTPGGTMSMVSPGSHTMHQPCHTTGTSSDVVISSPTSSHTDYMPSTSSAIRIVVTPSLNVQSTEEGEEMEGGSGPAPQSVALVTPRIEGTLPVAGSSSSASSSTNSSNTVTTSDYQSQTGHKRTREEGDGETDKSSPQVKRTRQSEVFHHTLSHSEVSEIEYQVPTSSQRDQEDDMVIMLEDSEDEGNNEDREVEEQDDEFAVGGILDAVGGYSPDMNSYEETSDIEEDNGADGGSNEVEVIEDSNEVPVSLPAGEVQQDRSSEATSSANDNSNDHVVVSHASQSFRTRSVPPLNRAQPSLNPYEEVGDDCIVPSTPTLFLPCREEPVSSPQVPHQRFTFSEPTPGTSRRDDSGSDDPGTGRSVPSTPLIASPQDVGHEQAEPSVPILLHVATNEAEEDMPPPVPSVDDQEDTLDEPEMIVHDDSDDVTSEGEKPPAATGELMEEGREAEASEPIARTGGTARRSGRPSYPLRRGPSRRPTPIVWNEPGSSNMQVSRNNTRSTTRGRGRRW